MVQFLKYAFAGAIATGVNVAAFFAFAYRLFPCLTPDDKVVVLLSRFIDVTVAEIPDGARSVNALWCNAFAFVISNAACYVMNRLFVFKPGRHSMAVEALLFFLVSGASFALGSAAQTALIALFGLSTSVAFATNLVASVLINYAMRKFVIFKG